MKLLDGVGLKKWLIATFLKKTDIADWAKSDKVPNEVTLATTGSNEQAIRFGVSPSGELGYYKPGSTILITFGGGGVSANLEPGDIISSFNFAQEKDMKEE